MKENYKYRVLAALKEQYKVELESGYDVKESLLALSAVELWVEHNKSTNLKEFLSELDSFYENKRKHWKQSGEYSGALGTLGSCYALIYQACSKCIT